MKRGLIAIILTTIITGCNKNDTLDYEFSWTTALQAQSLSQKTQTYGERTASLLSHIKELNGEVHRSKMNTKQIYHANEAQKIYASSRKYLNAKEDFYLLSESKTTTHEQMTKVFENLVDAVYTGESRANLPLGIMYQFGYGTTVNIENAIWYYLKALEMGEGTAQHNLTVIYEVTLGDRESQTKALKFLQTPYFFESNLTQNLSTPNRNTEDYRWYLPAANNGMLDAQYALGKAYKAKRDFQMAKHWIEKASEKGSLAATFELGHMYSNGYGVRQNPALAHKYYRQAAEQGYIKGMIHLAEILSKDKNTLEQGKEWYGKVCDLGVQLGCDKYASKGMR